MTMNRKYLHCIKDGFIMKYLHCIKDGFIMAAIPAAMVALAWFLCAVAAPHFGWDARTLGAMPGSMADEILGGRWNSPMFPAAVYAALAIWASLVFAGFEFGKGQQGAPDQPRRIP